ncbi:unnamed protein product [Moneuplotes crassus]|uniref:Uncharacterized protein n=1 Tax=Euplotes crassus TaxID=5936 RepID=A0AAD1U187_EUPCR|nr:unnamed protein product [Moneuplotes crassus]
MIQMMRCENQLRRQAGVPSCMIRLMKEGIKLCKENNHKADHERKVISNRRYTKNSKCSIADITSSNIKFPINRKQKNEMIHRIYETRLTNQLKDWSLSRLCIRPNTNLKVKRSKQKNLKFKQRSPVPNQFDVNKSAVVMNRHELEPKASDMIVRHNRRKMCKMKLILQQKYWPNNKIIRPNTNYKRQSLSCNRQKFMVHRKKNRNFFKKTPVKNSSSRGQRKVAPMSVRNVNKSREDISSSNLATKHFQSDRSLKGPRSSVNQHQMKQKLDKFQNKCKFKSRKTKRVKNNFTLIDEEEKEEEKSVKEVCKNAAELQNSIFSDEVRSKVETSRKASQLKKAETEKHNNLKKEESNAYSRQNTEVPVRTDSSIIFKTTKGHISVMESKDSLNEKPSTANIYQRLFSKNFDKESDTFEDARKDLDLKRTNTQGSERYIRKIEKEKKKVEEWKRSQRRLNTNNKYIETLKSERTRLNGKTLPRPADVRVRQNFSYHDSLTNRILQRGKSIKESSQGGTKDCNYFNLV